MVASGSRISDGEEGTDIGAAADADWLKRAASWDLVRQSGVLSLAPSAMQSWCVRVRSSPVARWNVTSLVVKDSAELATWLDKYRLGQLWTQGKIGGNRW